MRALNLVAGIFIVLFSGSALGGPLQIESERLEIQHAKHQATFTGHVHLVRDDFELWSDKLVAYYQANSGDIKLAKAFGRVRIRKQDKRGSSDKAILDNLKHVITLIGNAEMEQENGKVRGSTIVHSLDKGYTEVLQGRSGRVKMRLESEADTLAPIEKP